MIDIVSRLALVIAPTVLPLHLNVVKAHLYVEPTDNNQDATIMAYLRAALGQIDGRDGTLGRALCTQTWDYTLDNFPRSTRFNKYAAIELPLPPLQSVTSLKYFDSDGAEQTLDTSKYAVSGVGAWGPARVVPAFGEVWPSVRDIPDAVTVRFVAGYTGTTNTQNAVPEPIRQALLLAVGHFYENRQEVQAGLTFAELPQGAKALLYPFQVHTFA